MMSLVEMRERRGLTQEEAAQKLGYGTKVLYLLERGKPQVLARRNFGKVAKLYGVTWDEIAEAVEKAQRRARRRGRKGAKT